MVVGEAGTRWVGFNGDFLLLQFGLYRVVLTIKSVFIEFQAVLYCQEDAFGYLGLRIYLIKYK